MFIYTCQYLTGTMYVIFWGFSNEAWLVSPKSLKLSYSKVVKLKFAV